jgi:hypothetical protein
MAGSQSLSPQSPAGLARNVVWNVNPPIHDLDTNVLVMGKRGSDFLEQFGRYLEIVESIDDDNVEYDGRWFTDVVSILLDVKSVLSPQSVFRKFGRTAAGNLGNMPGHAEVGDKTCVLYGGRVPYVIRPCGNGEYAFIGECYLDGFMDGETMDLDIETETFTLV